MTTNTGNTKTEQELIKEGRKKYRLAYESSDPERATKRKAYNKEWKKRHPEKQAEYMKRFYLKHATMNTESGERE